MTSLDLPGVTLLVIRALEQLRIPFQIGGSLASSALGVPRSTLDADLVADMLPGHADSLAALLQPDFYVSVPMIRDAVHARSSFNVLHSTSGFKVDVFLVKNRPFDRQAFGRSILRAWPDESSPPVPFATAEDILLHKLEWFRLGDEISDRQWGDILGVLRVQGDRLDQRYLQRWSAEIGVADLLQRAIEQAG